MQWPLQKPGPYLLNLALLFLFDLLILVLVIINLLFGGLLSPQADGIVDELAVLLDQVLEAALLQVLQLVLLEV